MWHCSFKFAFDYWALKDADGVIKKSVHIDNKEELISLKQEGDILEKLSYKGCPVHNQPPSHEVEDEIQEAHEQLRGEN